MTPEQAEDRLAEEMALCRHDPYRFVMIAFPWGESELGRHEGPDDWQRDVLMEIGQRLKSGESVNSVIALAVASGHGVGKSCVVSWLLLWAISTLPDTRGVITANTESQLRTKTWAELSKWHRLCITRHWFNLSATSISSVDPEHERTWRIDKIAWSEENTEAFAGLHNQGRRIFVAFDESSAIPDIIWETTEGALTDSDTEIIWTVFGNPTRNTGRFRECFGSLKHRWITKQIDSRTVRITNKKQIAEWVADYGEDSDFVRIRVRGAFPRVGNMQFISTEVVELAMRRHEDDVAVTLMDPLVMGVDVARFGCFDDKTEILTDGGWKFFSTLSGKERVLTLRDNVAEWGEITQIHCYPFVGNLNLYESQNVNFCVTDNHNMLVRSHQKSARYVLKRFEDLPEQFMVKSANDWGGSSPPTVTFETEVPMPNGGIRRHKNEFSSLDWASFLGWFLSEGNVYRERRDSPRYRIMIAQNPGPKQVAIQNLLDRMGIQWRMTPTGRQVEFTSQSIGKYLLEKCGHGAANKSVPHEVKEGAQPVIEAFLDAYLAGDGSCKAGGNGRYYVTSSWKMANDIHELLAKVGRAGKLSLKNLAGSSFTIDGRHATRLSDTFVVYERKKISTRYGGPRDRFLHKSRARKIPYSGNVWCVSTPLKTIFVRRGGVPMWSGNSDASVIKIRRGRDARTYRSIKLRGVDTMTLATRVVDEATRLRVDAIFVDGGGVGGGVVDRLRQLHMPNVYEVQFGGKPDRSTAQESGPIIYANKAAEMWGLMRDWLKYAILPEDKDLADELTSREFGYVMREGRDAIMLEKKEDMRRRGLASPDDADALALTFAFPVQPSRHQPQTGYAPKPVHQVSYDPMQQAWNPQGQQPQQQRAPWMPHGPYGSGR